MGPMKPAAFSNSTLPKYTKALMVSLGYRDMVTQLHSKRVLGLSEEIGAQYGLSEKDLGILRIAATFHDIGKIGTPDRVLLKRSRLDDAEWRIMKQHSEAGEIIMSATGIASVVSIAQAIRHHHEHYDGQGYPDGLSGKEISILSRIISIADSYDAMAMTRPYHRNKTHSEIMAILLKEAGEKHDPELMRLFCELIEFSKFIAPAAL